MKLNTITKGEGEPIFFQHGLGGDTNQVLQFLSDIHGYKIISTDCTGHGKTPFTSIQDVSFNQYADSVIGTANHFNIEKAIYGGISMGASVALNIAARYPEMVRALILVRPAWFDNPHPYNLEPLYQLAENVDTITRENISSSPYFNSLFNNYPYLRTAIIDTLYKNHSSLKAGLFQKMINDTPVNSIKDIKRLGIPILILSSQDDYMHPVEIAQAIHDNYKQAIYHELPSRYLEPEKFQGFATFFIQQFLSGLK